MYLLGWLCTAFVVFTFLLIHVMCLANDRAVNRKLLSVRRPLYRFEIFTFLHSSVFRYPSHIGIRTATNELERIADSEARVVFSRKSDPLRDPRNRSLASGSSLVGRAAYNSARLNSSAPCVSKQVTYFAFFGECFHRVADLGIQLAMTLVRSCLRLI